MAAKVLIADDEESILRSTALLLEDLGYDVATVNRAEEILAAALRERPDIILQDVRMPGLIIDQLVADVRAHPELGRVRIVLFTAGMDADDVGSRVGTRVLEKPFRPAELLQALA